MHLDSRLEKFLTVNGAWRPTMHCVVEWWQNLLHALQRVPLLRNNERAVNGAFKGRILVLEDLILKTHVAAANCFVKSFAAAHRGCEASLLYVGYVRRVAR